ncbi:MAG: restriction endonuclease subunit S [Thermoanaerobaculia bacterium]|nr:restriction endonuclease subunit S [Thermoanaerobaculia bacterium]
MKGWRTQPLGELCDVLDSLRRPITKHDRVSGEYPYYGATGILDYVAGYLFDERLVLVGEDGAKWGPGESSAFAVKGRVWVNNHAHVLRPHRDKLLDQWLIHHLNHSDLREFVSGLTVPKLNQGNLRVIPVPVPRVEEQRRIVGLLDDAFAGITAAATTAERNARNARAVFESYRDSVIHHQGWELKTLGDLCERVEYGTSAKSKPMGRMPVLRMGNIQNERLDWTNLVYTDDDAEIAKYRLKKGDVLFNRTNSVELVGKSAIYLGERPALFAGYLIRIHRREGLVDAGYLNYFLNSSAARDYGRTVMISSVSQANISGTKLLTYVMPTPPLSEQKAIVKKLDALRDEIARLSGMYESKLTALAALKQSLLHRAFTGQL